jgi:hypothetical protein
MPQRSIIIRIARPKYAPSKPDILPDDRWRIPMKKMFLAALTVLSLTAGVAQMASASVYSNHQGPYDNTANSLGGRYVGGGGAGNG